ncbi:hypothetical protein F4819DRAFT_453146 [Hypoxylon fuscum]|nr:hypothetical protein F4819DRAFT_453146 [Hypoxylon fuscum]
MTIDDPEVCEKGANTLLDAIVKVRQESNAGLAWKPRIVVLSTCGINKAGRDFPLATLPIYKFMLKVPHLDKMAMEKALVSNAERVGYTHTIVRPSLLNDDTAPQKEIRVGLDNAFVVGYYISRDDTGRWIYENLLDERKTGQYENRIATITW